MTDHNRIKTKGLIVAAALILVAAPMIGAVGAVTTDTSTTPNSPTTELKQGTELTDINNDSKVAVLRVKADSNKTKVTIRMNSTGRVIYENSSLVQYDSNTTSDEYWTRANISYPALWDAERHVGENVTLKATVINNTDASDPAMYNFTFKIVNDKKSAVVYLSNADVDASDDLTTKTRGITFGPLEGTTYASITDEESIGDNTTVTYVMGDTNLSDAFGNAVSSMSLESGDMFLLTTSKVESNLVVTYYKAAPSDASGTYAVYHPSYHGAGKAVTFHYSDEYHDESSVENKVLGNKPPSLGWGTNAWGLIQKFGVGGFWKIVQFKTPMPNIL